MISPSSFCPAPYVRSVGDVVITRRNDRRLIAGKSGWVRNGGRWTVASVHDDGSVTVRRAGHQRGASGDEASRPRCSKEMSFDTIWIFSMHAVDAQFLGLVKLTSQFEVPVYQRTYAWGEPECEQAFEYQMGGG